MFGFEYTDTGITIDLPWDTFWAELFLIGVALLVALLLIAAWNTHGKRLGDPRRWFSKNYVRVIVGGGLLLLALALKFYLLEIMQIVAALVDRLRMNVADEGADPNDLKNLAYAAAILLAALVAGATLFFTLIKVWVNERHIRTTEEGHITDRIAKAVEQIGTDKGANLWQAELLGANLGRANLQGADLGETMLKRADLGFAKIQGASLLRAEMQAANLTGAEMQGAFLSSAMMQGAILRATQMQGAFLKGVKMQGADLLGAMMDKSTLLKETDFFGSALSLLGYSDVAFSAEQIESAFGDRKETLPDHLPKPEHWVEGEWYWDDLYTQWNAWQKSIGFDPDKITS